MSQIDIPVFAEGWTHADLLTWINSRTESSKDLLEAVDAEISVVHKRMNDTKAEVERMKEEESVLEACGRLCFELRDRLKLVLDAHAKEQLVKEFDAIAVFDKADSRAAQLANIILARKAWTDGVDAIESLGDGEPAPENVVFSLQEAYTTLSKYVAVDERRRFLEKVKDVFLSWYSTRVVLALQTDVESLSAIKQKYDTLGRTDDFNAVIKHYIMEQSKLNLHQADSLPDVFLDVQNAIVASYSRLREGHGWAERVLSAPSEFIADALGESVTAQWDAVKRVCDESLMKTREDDPSGALSLRMVLALRQVVCEVSAQSEETEPLAECVRSFGLQLLASVAADYAKLALSFLAAHCNIYVGTGPTASNLEQLSNGLSQLIKESDYLVQITKETFDNLAVIYVIPAFRSMYENLISLFAKFYKTYMEKANVKDSDILRLISISGQMMSWIETDRQRLKDMLESYQLHGSDSFISKISDKLVDDITNFEKKISAKAEGDLGIAKARSELRKLNKRFVGRGVELLARPLTAKMAASLKEMRSDRLEKGDVKAPEVEVPAFGTTPNECITAAGVALLSLAHQLSACSHDTNMAAALATASKVDAVEDVASWWVEKCAIAVQECFIDGIGEVAELPATIARQFAVDYVYLADVFEDLGTLAIPEFNGLRQTFVDLEYINE